MIGLPLALAMLAAGLWGILQIALLFLPPLFSTPPGSDELVWIETSRCEKYWADGSGCSDWTTYRTTIERGTAGYCDDPWAGGWVWDLVAWHLEQPLTIPAVNSPC